jgi:hypothetical protein
LDRWWEDDDYGWGTAVQFRFTVAVVEDGEEQARKEFVIDNPWPEEPLPVEFWADLVQVPAEDVPPDATTH